MALYINKEKFRLPISPKPGQPGFIREKKKKDLIVLHFTAGTTVEGAFQSWKTSDIRIGTAYIMDQNGAVFEIFDPDYYALHLGVKGSYDQDRRSIAIEIVNPGPLKKIGDDLCYWPRNFTAKYCTIHEKEKYVQASYRGFEYYAAYTPAQLDAIPKMVKLVCTQHNIPYRIPPEDKRDKCDLEYFSSFTGVASHQNFRPDKFDVGPAFPWDRVLIPEFAPNG